MPCSLLTISLRKELCSSLTRSTTRNLELAAVADAVEARKVAMVEDAAVATPTIATTMETVEVTPSYIARWVFSETASAIRSGRPGIRIINTELNIIEKSKARVIETKKDMFHTAGTNIYHRAKVTHTFVDGDFSCDCPTGHTGSIILIGSNVW